MAAEEMAHLAMDSRVRIIDRTEAEQGFAADARDGLSASPKTLPPKYFYDELGSILFEAICCLPEYYVARAETEILAARSGSIASAVGQPVRLVELGCGSGKKTRHLIRAALAEQPHLTYVPIDVDLATLRSTAEAIASEYATLSVSAIAGTFERGLAALPEIPVDGGEATLVAFLGSTMGNLEPGEREHLLRLIRRTLRDGDALLLGVDLAKAPEILIPAYDDALAVTAAFNLNLLVRMNRELNATFDLTRFRHAARYDTALQRIEMHLVSTIEQRIRVGAANLDVQFAAGESIHTESSYKFDRTGIDHLARSCGFRLSAEWTDVRGLFCDYLLIAS